MIADIRVRCAFNEDTTAVPSREIQKMLSEQTRHDVPTPGVTCDPCISLNLRRVHGYFLVALLAGFISKAGAMYPSLSPDDYVQAFPAPEVMDLFIGQGRGLAALMMLGLRPFGLTFASIQLPVFFLSLAAVAWFTAVAVNAVADRRISFPVAAAGAALIASHPYLSSYYLFRMSIINHVVVYAFVAIALMFLVDASRSAWQRVLVSSIIIAIGCNANQMALLLYVVCGAAWALSVICRQLEETHNWDSRNFYAGFFFVTGTLVSLVAYIAINSGLKKVMGIASVQEYTPHLAGGPADMLRTLWTLGNSTLWGQESIFPLALKQLCLGLGLVAIVMTSWRQWRWVAAAMLLLVGGIVVSVVPMVVSWGVYVPRTFSALGPVFGLTFILLAHGWRPGSHRIFAGCLFMLASIFTMLSGTMFYQQKMLTDWDQFLARSIYSDAHTRGWLGPNVTLRVAAAWPYHGKELMSGSGINESAFNSAWTYKNLFLLATGESVNVTNAPRVACDGHPHWPDAGYLYQAVNGDVYACMR